MSNKKIIAGVLFLDFIIVISLVVVSGSNIPELTKNNQVYENNLQEQNRELTLLEQMPKLDVFKEKCKEVRADPNSYYPKVVDMCK